MRVLSTSKKAPTSGSGTGGGGSPAAASAEAAPASAAWFPGSRTDRRHMFLSLPGRPPAGVPPRGREPSIIPLVSRAVATLTRVVHHSRNVFSLRGRDRRRACRGGGTGGAGPRGA